MLLSIPSFRCSRRLSRVFPCLAFLVLLSGSCGPALGGLLDHPVVLCQLPADSASVLEPRADGLLRAAYGQGSRLIVVEPDGSHRALAQDFASACDPDVSFDGERILFAGQKKAGTPWNIWEIHRSGSGARQITHESRDCRSPIYLSTFYTITSSEPWYTVLFVCDDGVINEAGSAPATSLYTVRLDGSELRRITFNLSNEMDPFLMQDGLVLFAGWNHQTRGRWASGRVALFGVQADGIDYSLFGGTQGERIQHMPTVTTEGTVVFIEADSAKWDGAGHLASVSLQRPHHSYRRLRTSSEGLFHSPSPLADGSLLISRRPVDGSGDHGLFRLRPADGRLEPIFDEPGSHEIHAKALAARPRPDGRSSTVRPESPTGKLYGLNIYEADPALAPHLEPGAIRRLRVIEGVPPSQEAVDAANELNAELGTRFDPVGRRLLGEVPVEEDGSFHFDLPADVSVELQSLDQDGLALATCGWIWVKQREYRGCIGCHEDPELTPVNRFVQAAGRPANQLTLPAERRRTVTFRQQVAPIVNQRCGRCHSSAQPGPQLVWEGAAAGVQLTYAALIAGKPKPASAASGISYVDPGRARTSYLIWLLSGRNTSRPWDGEAGSVRVITRQHEGLLEPSELRTFIEWIDLGAQWSASWSEPASEGQGAKP